jgi:hypothetical protein
VVVAEWGVEEGVDGNAEEAVRTAVAEDEGGPFGEAGVFGCGVRLRGVERWEGVVGWEGKGALCL